jgi:hypothetical protein
MLNGPRSICYGQKPPRESDPADPVIIEGQLVPNHNLGDTAS